MTIKKFGFVFLFFLSAVIVSEAHIRGANKADDRELDAENEDRDLQYYANRRYRYYWGGYYGNGNGNKNMYYRRYYNRNKYYNKNKYYQKNKYYGDDGATDDATDDAAEEAMEDEIIYYDDMVDLNSTDWVSTLKDYEAQAEESFFNWYRTPPGEWSSEQWAWFSGLMLLFVGVSFCACSCCCSSSTPDESAKERKAPLYDLDDYTSVGSRNGSFMTSNSSASTEWDDNATYDSIMRLRSD